MSDVQAATQADAVRDEIASSKSRERLLTADEAFVRHMNADLDSLETQLHAAAETLAATTVKTEQAMSDNVRKCPVFKPKTLPKLPEVPDDLTIDDVVAACAEVDLSPAQKIAVAALVCGKTALWAAHKAGVSPRTVHRWRQLPLFNETITSLSDTTLEAALVRMRTLLLRSTHVISTALREADRERWAMRIIASPQIWKMGRRPEAAAEVKK